MNIKVFVCSAFVLFQYSANAQQAKVVQACVDRSLDLSCPNDTVIQVHNVELGDSGCYGSSCCPDSDDCTHQPSSGHRQHVLRSCNGQRSCMVRTEQKKIPCGYFGARMNNDFERITYYCVVNGTTVVPENISFVDDVGNDVIDDVTTPQAVVRDQAGTLHIIVPIIVLLILLVVGCVVLVACFLKRRKKGSSKTQPESVTNPQYITLRHLEDNDAQRNHIESPDAGGHVYEMPSPDRTSNMPLVADNVYSEVEDTGRRQQNPDQHQTKPAATGVYSEAKDWNKSLYDGMLPPDGQAPYVEGDGGTSDKMSPGQSSPVYGNVDNDQTNIYSEAKPWDETNYGSIGMRPEHPESEYVAQSDDERLTPDTGRPTSSMYCEMGSR